LDRAVERAASYGLTTRCVTNGYWAVSPEAASRRLQALKQAGLTEVNFSTGDDHQQFVPFERIVNGVIAGAMLGLSSLIAVEGNQEARFTVQDVLRHERLAQFLQHHPQAQCVKIISNIWIPFHQGRALSHSDEAYRRVDQIDSLPGCHNILDTIVVTPDESLAACCGLTMEHIPEMKLGSLRQRSLRELYEAQFDDFLKIWLWVEGPEKILYFVTRKDHRIQYDNEVTHPCQTCARIFLDPLVREVLRKHYQEKVPDILFRYHIKRTLGRKVSQANGAAQVRYGA
jgi:hypothetical protein